MTLEFSDWLIVGLYFIASAGIALIYTRRASQSLDEYFVSGRALPWWLAGTSMVATTFAADTPLAVTGPYVPVPPWVCGIVAFAPETSVPTTVAGLSTEPCPPAPMRSRAAT